MKKKIILIFLSVLLFATASVFFFVQERSLNKGTSSQAEEKGYTDPKTFTNPSDITFILDQQGYSSSQKPNIFTGKLEVPTGTEIPIGVNVSKEKKIDPALIRITLMDTDSTSEFTDIEVKDMKYGFDYVSKYTPEKPGKSTISVEVMGTSYKGFLEVSVFDRSLMEEIDISEKEFLRNEKMLRGDTKLDWSNLATVKSQFKGVEGTPWQLDYPGYISLPFGSEQTRTKGELKLYSLAPLEKYKDQSVIPSFYEHILALSNYLRSKKENNQEINYDVFTFPPVNAAMAGISHIKNIRGNGFYGVSYIYGGHFQALDPATQPTYVYQGLSKDDRYFIYFEHELFSKALRSYIKKNNDCSPYTTQEKYQTCVEGSFAVLERDYALDPNLDNLNSFTETFEIRK